MNSTQGQRGTTLIEVVVAMGVLALGATGMMSMYTVTEKLEGDSRHLARANAIAQDLINQIEFWRYDDVRLSNDSTANDGAIGDPAFAFENTASPVGTIADHGENDLTKSGSTWLGLPATPGYERYWNVAQLDDTNANGTADAVRIAVIVRWPTSRGSWRRVVLTAVKANPAEAR